MVQPPWHDDAFNCRVSFDLTGSDIPVTGIVWERWTGTAYTSANFSSAVGSVAAGDVSDSETRALRLRVTYTFNGLSTTVVTSNVVTTIALVHAADFDVVVDATDSEMNVTGISAVVTSAVGEYSTTPISLTSVSAESVGDSETLALSSLAPGWRTLRINYTVAGLSMYKTVSRPAAGTNSTTVYVVCDASPPTDLDISETSMVSGVASPVVGYFTPTDADSEEFTYTLVEGTGDTDNESFGISGGSLQALFTPDYDTKSSYTVRVRVTDEIGLYFEKSFGLSVTPSEDGVATYEGMIGDTVGMWSDWTGNGSADLSFRFTQDVNSAIVGASIDGGGGWRWSSSNGAYYPAAVFAGGTQLNPGGVFGSTNSFGQAVSVRGCSVSTGGSVSGRSWTIQVTYANGTSRNYLATT